MALLQAKHTENYKEMSDKGYLLDGAKAIDGIIYDTFNPEAAKMYWINSQLYSNMTLMAGS